MQTIAVTSVANSTQIFKMPRTTGQQRRGGRIHPHQRDTNDDAAILGNDLDLGDNFQQNYNQALKHALGDSPDLNDAWALY